MDVYKLVINECFGNEWRTSSINDDGVWNPNCGNRIELPLGTLLFGPLDKTEENYTGPVYIFYVPEHNAFISLLVKRMDDSLQKVQVCTTF